MKRMRFVLCSILLASINGCLGSAVALAEDAAAKVEAKPKSDGALSPAALYKKLSPSVFEIVLQDDAGNQLGNGSCVVVGDHEVVTNKHVVAFGSKALLKLNGDKLLPAELTYVSPDEDLVLMHVPGLTAPAVKVRPSKALEVGEHVFAIGSPYAMEESLSEGLISGLRPKGDVFYIQNTAQMLPGSSGGGLFDDSGNLIGITSLLVNNTYFFALPAEQIEPMHKHPISSTQKLSDPKFRAKLNYETAHAYMEFSYNQQASMKGRLRVLEAEFMEHAVNLDPTNDLYLMELGEMAMELDKPTAAVQIFEHGLKLNPKSGQMMYLLAGAYVFTKQQNKALALYDRLAVLDADWTKKLADMFKVNNIDINAPRTVAAAAAGPSSGSTPPADREGRNDKLAQDFVAYVAGSIKKNLPHQIKITERRDVGLVFRIAADGTVSNIKIAASSGSSEIDDAAKIALVNAAPFSWVPKSLLDSTNSVDLKITVDLNPLAKDGKPAN